MYILEVGHNVYSDVRKSGINNKSSLRDARNAKRLSDDRFMLNFILDLEVVNLEVNILRLFWVYLASEPYDKM